MARPTDRSVTISGKYVASSLPTPRPQRQHNRGHCPILIQVFFLSVSNSLSGRLWELDQGPAVGDRTDIVQLGTGHHVSVGEGQRLWPFNDAWLRTSLEEARRQAPRNGASILDSARELRIRDAQRHR